MSAVEIRSRRLDDSKIIGVVRMDLDGRVTDASDACLDMLEGTRIRR